MGQAYGRSCTGVFDGLFGYLRGLTGMSFMGPGLFWYTWLRISCPLLVAWLYSARLASAAAAAAADADVVDPELDAPAPEDPAPEVL